MDELKRNWYRTSCRIGARYWWGGGLRDNSMVEGRSCTGLDLRRLLYGSRCVDRALSSIGEADLPSICPLWRAPSVLVWAELTRYLPAEEVR